MIIQQLVCSNIQYRPTVPWYKKACDYCLTKTPFFFLAVTWSDITKITFSIYFLKDSIPQWAWSHFLRIDGLRNNRMNNEWDVNRSPLTLICTASSAASLGGTISRPLQHTLTVYLLFPKTSPLLLGCGSSFSLFRGEQLRDSHSPGFVAVGLLPLVIWICRR